MSQLVSEYYRCNTSRTAIFLKTTARKCLGANIRTVVILTGGKLTGFYFLHLLYAIYFSVITHRRKGMKVSFLPSGDVNPGPVSSRQGLIEDSPYRVVGVACLSCDRPRPRN
jgi:hypothetical protein